jgi:subtilisin family serine protease
MPFRRGWWLLLVVGLAGIPATPAAAPDRQSWIVRLGADRWHAAGHRGQGVKIAILDTGFRNWRAWLGKALPTHIEARSFRLDGNLEFRPSSHGVLCAEIVHSLAPDAEILFANWEPDRPDTFVRAVAWARQQGARILACSVIMPAWSDGEGGGPVHAALSDIIGGGSQPGDLIACACAGNTAQRHWSGRCIPDAAGWHQWRNGQRDNALTPWEAGERVSVEACWPAGGRFRLVVAEERNGNEIGRNPEYDLPEPSRRDAGMPTHCAVVRFAPTPNARYVIRIQALSDHRAAFHVAVLGGWLSEHTLRGSIPFPGDGPRFLTVGAWQESGQRAVYSSCGPNSAAPKPDFAATVPVATAIRDHPFSGTSAAAPQLAALAALVWSRHPKWTANQVKTALRDAAQDVAERGHDHESGYGLIRLPIDP